MPLISAIIAALLFVASILETGTIPKTRAYTYDELERLTNVAAPATPAFEEDYTYDEEGNRETSHISGLHITDAANRLIEDDQFTRGGL